MQVTKEMKDALRQFADRLPISEEAHSRPKTGAELLKKYPALRDPAGQPLQPNRRYFVGGRSVAVNHLKRLVAAYETGGMPAVVKYLQPYEAFLGTPDTEPAAEPAQPAPRAAEGFPDGRFELGCGDCARCASIDCPNTGALAHASNAAE